MAEKPLKIADIVATVSLDTRVLAGKAGLEREVRWAHSCEMADPARWLGPGEFLMTVGLCVPAEPQAQRELIARLDEAGIVGMSVGDHGFAELSVEMLDEAEARGFPLLMTAAEVPFASIGRTVAAANATSHVRDVLLLSKIYHQAAGRRGDPVSLVDGLGELLGVGLQVIEETSGVPVFGGTLPPSRAGTRASRSRRRYPLRGTHAAVLLIDEPPDCPLIEGFVLTHVLKVLEVEADAAIAGAKYRQERSEKLLGDVMAARGTLAASKALGPDLAASGFRVVAVPLSDGPTVAIAVAIARLPVLSGPSAGEQLVVATGSAVDDLRKLLRDLDVPAGASSSYRDIRDCAAAAGEAARALSLRAVGSREWIDFDGVSVSLLTRSRQEAVEIATEVLGPLARDDPKATVLRTTLICFLRHDRQWAPVAEELGIHRQTLAYRLSRIKELTGRDMNRTADLSALWLACEAWNTFLCPEATRP